MTRHSPYVIQVVSNSPSIMFQHTRDITHIKYRLTPLVCELFKYDFIKLDTYQTKTEMFLFNFLFADICLLYFTNLSHQLFQAF